MNNTPEASVIIAVYNHWEWLSLILQALARQTFADFETVIADDGSSPETVGNIREFAAAHPEMKIIHSRQEDKGWRKNRSLNKAVKASSAPYLIFIDGDCVPHPEFVADHLRLRRPHAVIGGRRVDMPQHASDALAASSILPRRYFALTRLRILRDIFSQPLSETLMQLRRTIRSPFIAGRPAELKPGGFFGCNFGISREDLYSVNGFDERYPDPGTGEDTDLQLRLTNAGITPLKCSRHALMLHRRHKRLVFDSEPNARLYAEAKRNNTTWIATGLTQTGSE